MDDGCGDFGLGVLLETSARGNPVGAQGDLARARKDPDESAVCSPSEASVGARASLAGRTLALPNTRPVWPRLCALPPVRHCVAVGHVGTGLQGKPHGSSEVGPGSGGGGPAGTARMGAGRWGADPYPKGGSVRGEASAAVVGWGFLVRRAEVRPPLAITTAVLASLSMSVSCVLVPVSP